VVLANESGLPHRDNLSTLLERYGDLETISPLLALEASALDWFYVSRRCRN
jgi:hypothetical protein